MKNLEKIFGFKKEKLGKTERIIGFKETENLLKNSHILKKTGLAKNVSKKRIELFEKDLKVACEGYNFIDKEKMSANNFVTTYEMLYDIYHSTPFIKKMADEKTVLSYIESKEYLVDSHIFAELIGLRDIVKENSEKIMMLVAKNFNYLTFIRSKIQDFSKESLKDQTFIEFLFEKIEVPSEFLETHKKISEIYLRNQIYDVLFLNKLRDHDSGISNIKYRKVIYLLKKI